MSTIADKYTSLKDFLKELSLNEDEMLLLTGNLLLEYSSASMSKLDAIQNISVLNDVLEDYNKVSIELEYFPDSYTYTLATISHNLIALSNEIKVLKTSTYG
jgi:hypothetical protein